MHESHSIDMTPAAIHRRLKAVSDLYELGTMLEKFKVTHQPTDAKTLKQERGVAEMLTPTTAKGEARRGDDGLT